MATLYYVTAVERRLRDEQRLDAQRGGNLRPAVRHDLASFFERADAEAHLGGIGTSWADGRVEERSEEKGTLHAAHGGKRGA